MSVPVSGGLRLFRMAGIQVYLHWSWLLVAVFEMTHRKGGYSQPLWNVLEYLALFGLVLLHEFGHALACRSAGGQAEQILLWPLGGVAFVAPPQRPGPTLWSIAAGPLVNVVIMPLLLLGLLLARVSGLAAALPDAYGLLRAVSVINAALLIFNLLPVYPLDGGQILRSLLWFVLGRGPSLMAASIIGFGGVAALLLLAVLQESLWLGVLAVFILLNCWRGLQQALALGRLARAPHHAGYACPACGAAPPAVPLWRCSQCGTAFDTFAAGAVCPGCGVLFDVTRCPECGETRPFAAWARPPLPPMA